MRSCFVLGSLAACLLALAAPRSSAQTGCLTGNVTMALGLNGAIKVCPQFADQVPHLQRQLDEMRLTLKGNEALLLEITHSARSVNTLARNVDQTRQVELLRSFSTHLQGLMSANQQKTQTALAELANKLDALDDTITQLRQDQKTAQQTQNALNGRLGDAIAALDVSRAQQQLDSIQAKLNQIGEDTQEIKQTLEQQAAEEKAAREAAQKQQQAIEQDPNMYTRAQIMPLGAGGHSFMVFFYSRPPLYPPFVDSSFSMAFHKKSGESWRVDATDKQVAAGGELWKINLAELGDSAAICFVAHDQASGRLKEWMQRYTITSSSTTPGGVNFIPSGSAKMWLTEGGPCDGVTIVRAEAPAVSSEEYAQQQIAKSQEAARRQIANSQQQIAQTLAPYQRRGAMFAIIRASGKKVDYANGGRWQIKVDTQPLRGNLYDAHVQASLVDAAGTRKPLALSAPQLFVNIESRYALVDQIAAKAVVCLTARADGQDKAYRLTQWFNISTQRIDSLGRGEITASFIPAQEPALTEASDAPCQ
jgi:hypothetical protein